MPSLRVLMFFVVLISFFPNLGLAEELVEERVIEVQEKSLNIYGHWAGEVVLVRLMAPTMPDEKWRVILDGWQSYPQLPAREMPPKPKKPKRPEYLVLDSIFALRDSLLLEKAEKDYIVARCREQLLQSGYFEDLIPLDGSMHKAIFANGMGYEVVSVEIAPYRFTKQEREYLDEDTTRKVFAMVCNQLDVGGVVIIASHTFNEVIMIDAVDRQRPEFLLALQAIETAKMRGDVITFKNWKSDSVINSLIAEQMRNPMALSRKDGS